MKRNGIESVEVGWSGHEDCRYINTRQVNAACNKFFVANKIQSPGELSMAERKERKAKQLSRTT